MNNSLVRVAILAGGKSTRMGEDKAGLIVDGETLLLRAARLALTVTGKAAMVVGRTRPEDWPDTVSADFLPDAVADVGPLGGLLTALQAVNGPILALSCDLPALDAKAISWLVGQERGRLGVVTDNSGQWEPLFSIYTPACLPLVEANLAAQKRSLHGLIKAGGDGFAFVDAPPKIAAQLVNVNTPEEWDHFQKRR